MSKVTVKQAAFLVGKTKETINKATNNGTITTTRNASGHKVIDISELERIYPLKRKPEDLDQLSKPVKSGQQNSEPDTSTELAILRERLSSKELTIEAIKEERERERQQLESEIETLRSSLEKAQEQQGRALLLITDQSRTTKERVGDWEETIGDLKAQIANQETSLEERLLEIREEARQEAFRELKDHFWWQLLFKKRAG